MCGVSTAPGTARYVRDTCSLIRSVPTLTDGTTGLVTPWPPTVISIALLRLNRHHRPGAASGAYPPVRSIAVIASHRSGRSTNNPDPSRRHRCGCASNFLMFAAPPSRRVAEGGACRGAGFAVSHDDPVERIKNLNKETLWCTACHCDYNQVTS